MYSKKLLQYLFKKTLIVGTRNKNFLILVIFNSSIFLSHPKVEVGVYFIAIYIKDDLCLISESCILTFDSLHTLIQGC
jgi:hypothetical protein